MQATWFICPSDEQIVRVEHPLDCGASDEQWRALLRSCGIRVKNDSKPWGPLARRDFLNMLENEHPNRMPPFFDSRQAAEFELANRGKRSMAASTGSNKAFDSVAGSNKAFESNETPARIEEEGAGEPEKLLMAMELLRAKPEATDLEMAAALGLKTQGTARFWKIKAREVLAQEAQNGST